jgi:hypothetical protein
LSKAKTELHFTEVKDILKNCEKSSTLKKTCKLDPERILTVKFGKWEHIVGVKFDLNRDFET